MRVASGISLAVLLAWTALAQPVQAASEADKVDALSRLLGQVCLPIIQDGRSEADVTRDAGLRRAHPAWFPQAPPRGLRQYASPYPGIATLNMTDGTCALHVDTQDFALYASAVQQALAARGRPWTRMASADEERHVFCDPDADVAVTTFEGDPARFPAFAALHIRPSFEVKVMRGVSLCHAEGPLRSGAQR